MKTLLFVVGPLLLAGLEGLSAQSPLKVAGLAADAPLSIKAVATASRLTIDVTMEPEWHLYARDVGGGQPVAVTLPEQGAFVAAGKLIVPKSADGHLSGSFRLELPIRAQGRHGSLAATFAFMACDPLACLPPMEVSITGDVARDSRVTVLLAVDVDDDRSARITGFLEENGFKVKVRTYAQAKGPECDAHDVVLFDSKLFRKSAKGSRKLARGFPRTKTPIVAVGFLGTELIEAHGLAMTSGYI